MIFENTSTLHQLFFNILTSKSIILQKKPHKICSNIKNSVRLSIVKLPFGAQTNANMLQSMLCF